MIILLIVKKVLQDARIKITESGYIPGQAFPTDQAQLEGICHKINFFVTYPQEVLPHNAYIGICCPTGL